MNRIAGLLVLLCLVSGCRRPTPPPAAVPPAHPPARTPVTLLLNWFPEAEHGGYFAALVQGYYAEEGLDVSILPGGPGASVVPRVATRRVDFGVENADHVVLGRAQGAAVVALLAPIQTHPRCIMVHAESGITNLFELRNLTLAMNPGSAFAQYLQNRVPLAGVRLVPYAGNVSQFVTDPQVAQQAYAFSEPYAAKLAGANPRCLMLSDVGFNPYTSCLLASDALVREKPEVVRAMVRAAARGWEQYLRDPAQTHARIHDLNPEMSLPLLDFGQQALQALCHDPQAPDAVFGAMTLTRWEALCDQLATIKLIRRGAVNPAACFTVQFLPVK